MNQKVCEGSGHGLLCHSFGVYLGFTSYNPGFTPGAVILASFGGIFDYNGNLSMMKHKNQFALFWTPACAGVMKRSQMARSNTEGAVLDRLDNHIL